MGLYGSAPEPPDYSPIAEAQLALGQQSLDLMKGYLNDQKAFNERLMTEVSSGMGDLGVAADAAKETFGQLGSKMMEQLDQSMAFADRVETRYNEEFAPARERFLRDAEGYDTPERRRAEETRAQSEVGQAVMAERRNAEQRLAGYGIDPSMLRAGALGNDMDLQAALAKVQAGSEARKSVEATGYQLRDAALGQYAEDPRNAAAIRATGNDAGRGVGQAGAGVLDTGTARVAGVDTMTRAGAGMAGGYGDISRLGSLSTSAYGGASDALTSSYNAALGQYEADQQYGLPGLITTGIGIATGAGTSKVLAMEDGGVVPPMASPSRGAVPDDVGAALTAGEYVVPREVVAWKGLEFFEKLKSSVAKGQGGVPA